LTTSWRPVKPLASRSADMVASVPELTRRTWSTGARLTSSSASSTSFSVAVPNEVPRRAASRTASTTGGQA
jgi:hypothetical protein